MYIPIQNPVRQYLNSKNEVNSRVISVLKSGRWLFGENVVAFENAFSSYIGSEFAVTVANGTDALELALLATNAKGHEVITVANAGGYTTTACRVIDATPVYVDIDPISLLISPNEALRAVTSQTAAIVVTHLYGRLSPSIELLKEGLNRLGRSDVFIIEDCAQAHGAERGGIKAGSFGDLGTFSFYPTKNLGAMGDAGAIVTSNANLAGQLKQLRQYGWSERYHSEIPFGRNSRMDEIQAAVLLAKIPHLDKWNEQRRSIIARYKEAATGKLSIWLDDFSSFVAHLAIARHPERERIRQVLHDCGIMTDIHYPVLDCDQPSQVTLQKIVHDLSSTRKAVEEIFTLPCFPEMTEEEIAYVCEKLSQL